MNHGSSSLLPACVLGVDSSPMPLIRTIDGMIVAVLNPLFLSFTISKALAMPRQLPLHVRKQLCPLRFRSHAPNKMGQWEKTNQFGRGKKKWNDIVPVYSFFLFIYFRMWISTKEGSLYACFYAHINNVQGLSSTWLWSYSTHYNYIRARESFKDEDRVTSSSGTAFV